MMNLWLLLLVMLLLACCLVFLSLRSTKNTAPSRDTLNKQLYKQRLSELEHDEDQGIITQDPQVINELKLTLLDELPDVDVKNKTAYSSWLLLPGFAILLATASLYFLLGNYSKVQQWDDVMTRMPQLTELMLVQRGKGATDQDLQDFILGVRTRAMQDPTDLRSWDLMARIGMGTNDFQLALDSYQQALSIAPNDKAIQMSYAKVLAQMGDSSHAQQAEQIATSILASRPNDLEALSIDAFAALQQQDFTKAINLWERMLPLLSPENERREMLVRSIEYAKNQLAQASKQTKDVEPKKPSAVYKLRITLPDNIKPAANATLFVFAKAVDGSPIPLAVKRMPLPHFPVELSLSDADSMTASNKLSDVDIFYIGARIDADGNIGTQVGWQGKSAPIAKGNTVLTEIIIDEDMAQ